jgi:hypothetical protein
LAVTQYLRIIFVLPLTYDYTLRFGKVWQVIQHFVTTWQIETPISSLYDVPVGQKASGEKKPEEKNVLIPWPHTSSVSGQ